MNESNMYHLLKAYQCSSSSLQELHLPSFYWTVELRKELQQLLRTKGADLRKIHVDFKHVMPAGPSASHQQQNSILELRKEVWTIWKEYLLSPSSHNLQDLSVYNFTRRELMELATILQSRQHEQTPRGPLKSMQALRIQGQSSFDTLIQLVDFLGSHVHTRALPTYLDVSLWNGEELYANQSLTKLAQVMTRHYGIRAMNVSCAEYCPTPHADVLTDLYGGAQAVTVIQSMIALNRAGRQYLLHHPSCTRRGTQVLSHVAQHNSLDAIFHHVLENPSIFSSHRATTATSAV
jgi:hypothetical protein